MIVLLVGMVSCVTRSPLIEATVIDRNNGLFAEWGTDEQGKRFEHRFVGVRVKLRGPGVEDTVWLVQSWPEADRTSMPEVGEVFHLAELPTDSNVLPVEGKTYWYRELKLTEPYTAPNHR